MADYAETVAAAYRKDLWERQPEYIEFFVEKDAMAGVIQPVTDEFDVYLNVIRGNCSETFVFNVAEQWNLITKPIVAYYLGDHDPNGLKIEADLRKRLSGFCDREFGWERLAVTSTDFRNPAFLGFPVKRKGAVAYWKPYLDQYGDRCIEVDAIPAPEIRARVEAAILAHVDAREWQFLKDQEERERQDVFDLVRQLRG